MVSRVLCDAVGNAIYVNTQGPTQLACNNVELEGHGVEYHAQGFGSPIGRLVGMERCLSVYSVDELKRHGITIGENSTLRFLSGITVQGTLSNILRRDQNNILLSFENCTVKDVDGKLLFDPSWGMFDMAVGDAVVSVSGGSADQDAYPIYDSPSSSAHVEAKPCDVEDELFSLYSNLRGQREKNLDPTHSIESILSLDNTDWLLYFEALELAIQWNLSDQIIQALNARLAAEKDNEKVLISQGLKRLGLTA